MPIIVSQSVGIESYTHNPLDVISNAARTCYASQEKRKDDYEEKNFIRSLIRSGHESVIEHASASFRVVVDRAIANEIVRHRLASYSQVSTRYVGFEHDNMIKVIKPSDIRDNDIECFNAWFETCEVAERAYFNMIEHGYKKEVARSVLPLCLSTNLLMTMNFRAWRNFLKLRMDKAAHPDIRIVANMIHGALVHIADFCFDDIGVE